MRPDSGRARRRARNRFEANARTLSKHLGLQARCFAFELPQYPLHGRVFGCVRAMGAPRPKLSSAPPQASILPTALLLGQCDSRRHAGNVLLRICSGMFAHLASTEACSCGVCPYFSSFCCSHCIHVFVSLRASFTNARVPRVMFLTRPSHVPLAQSSPVSSLTTQCLFGMILLGN